MKKIVRLTERDLTRLVKRVILEQEEEMGDSITKPEAFEQFNDWRRETQNYKIRPKIVMKDGFKMSLQYVAHDGFACWDVMYPSSKDEELEKFSDGPGDEHYSNLKFDSIIKIIMNHGGIDMEKSLPNEDTSLQMENKIRKILRR